MCDAKVSVQINCGSLVYIGFASTTAETNVAGESVAQMSTFYVRNMAYAIVRVSVVRWRLH